jgi:SAM-dependent methyltransferase
MQRPSWAPLDVDVNQPSIARIWDWFLGGAHNFAVDREVGEEMLKAMPEGPQMARIHRMFLRRAVQFCVAAGVTQFLDIGSGIPTVGNVHEIAQQANPRCRVVYADIDPVAVAHTRRMLAGDPRYSVLQADLREPERILAAPELRDTLDLDQPVALLMIAVLHFVHDSDDPAGILARYRDALAPGSYLVIAHGSREIDNMPPEHLHTARSHYERSVAQVSLRSQPEVEAFFAGFSLEDPGVVWLQDWCSEHHEGIEDLFAPNVGYGGVGSKP